MPKTTTKRTKQVKRVKSVKSAKTSPVTKGTGTAKKPAPKPTQKPTTKPATGTVKTTPKTTPKIRAKQNAAISTKTVAAKSASTKASRLQSRGLLAVGAQAPEFTAMDASGKMHTLASISQGQKGKPFVLYFYPQDDTPGCTVEACDFRDLRPKFAKLGCAVFGVSPDSVESHRAFDAKFKLGLTLLADVPDASGVPPIAAAFGVWQEKNMYGKKYMGIVRTTYIIAGDGTVAARFDRVKVDGHVQAVLAAMTPSTR